MTDLQRLELKLGETRRKLAEAIGAAEPDMETVDSLTAEIRQTDSLLTATRLTEPEPTVITPATSETAEDRELAELRAKVSFAPYLAAAMAHAPVMGGAELEYNQHLGLAANYFPLELLAEHRAARNGDAEGNQATWLDRVISDTAAARLGVTFPTVAPGVAAYPVMSAGASGVQRGRTEAVTEGTYTVAVTELKPTRNAVHGIYSIEDELRLPGMAEAIERDMAASIMESIDLAVFKGDAGANENTADITGFQTAAITEVTVTQANKVMGDELLKVFLAYVEGRYAASLADVRIVASVGSNTLWGGTVHAATVSNETVAQFLRANGVTWTVRGGIDTNSANGDFGAYIGLARGAEGAAVAPVWNQGQLIRDGFGDHATKGEVALTLNYFWNFGIPRTANYKRLKYVT